MLFLAAILLVTVAPDAPKPAKAPTKAEQKAAEDDAAKKADDDAAKKLADDAKRAADTAAAAAAQKIADDAAAKRATDDAKKAEESALNARGLDARMRALCDQIAVPLKRLPGDYREQHFAVLPFEQAGADVQDRKLGVVVNDLVVTNLARDHHLPLVERAALAKILDEQALGQTGALADGQAAQIGKLSGARALIIGQVSDAGDSFRVSVRAIDGEAGTVIDGTAREVNLPKDELIAFSANAVVLKSKGDAMFRSAVLPGWGQAYNGEPVKAGVFGAAAGGLGLATIVTTGAGLYTGYVLYPTIGSRDEDKTLSADERTKLIVATRDGSNAAFVAGGILAGLTASVWSLNILDAYLSGTDVENLDAALAQN